MKINLLTFSIHSTYALPDPPIFFEFLLVIKYAFLLLYVPHVKREIDISERIELKFSV